MRRQERKYRFFSFLDGDVTPYPRGMSTHPEGIAARARRAPRWAGALEGILFVVGLAAQLFLWLSVSSPEGRAALILSMVAHVGIAAVRSRSVAEAAAAASAAAQVASQAPSSAQAAEAAAPDDERLAFPSTMTRPTQRLTWRDIEAIPGLEANAALRLHGGDERAYLQALRRFAQRYKDGVGHWDAWLDRNRWEDLERAVQALHQHAGSIGALRVQAGAGRLAMQCDSEDLLGGHAGLPALQDELTQVLQPLLEAGFADSTSASGASTARVPVSH